MKYYFDPETKMDYVNPKAKVVIVGITPGNSQTTLSRENMTKKKIKKENAFSGDMRKPLIEMLNYIKLNKYLGIKNCESLWDEDFDKVEFTSLLKDATYEIIDGKRKMFRNTSKILKEKDLQYEFEKGFKGDCKKYKDAQLFIALGTVSPILEKLKEEDFIKCDIITIPHPSGQNSGRIQVFLGKSNKRNDTSYENALKMRENAIKTINRLIRNNRK